MGKGAEGSSGAAARLLHVVALGGFIDLEGQGRAEGAQAGASSVGQLTNELRSPPYSTLLLQSPCRLPTQTPAADTAAPVWRIPSLLGSEV